MMRRPVRLWLCVEPSDMRCSYDGLAALVRKHLGADPLTGEGFVFINRRRTQMKCLYFERGGYVIWMKRLERGHFAAPTPRAGVVCVALSETEFAALIEGLDIAVRRRRKRWQGYPGGGQLGYNKPMIR